MQHNEQLPHFESAVSGGPTDFKTTSKLASEGHMGLQVSKSVDLDSIGSEKQQVNKQEAGRVAAPANKYDVFGWVKCIWHTYKFQCCMAIWLLITAYFIASMTLKEKTQLSDILPFILLYVFISFKMLFAFVDTALITKPVGKFYDSA
ncbi:hypothetical protein FBU59_002951, partial [Linderina macrospora]